MLYYDQYLLFISSGSFKKKEGEEVGEEGEEDTYATVELVTTSRLRQREPVVQSERVDVNYSTISELWDWEYWYLEYWGYLHEPGQGLHLGNLTSSVNISVVLLIKSYLIITQNW